MTGKVALVGGGSQGLGFAIAAALCREQAHVAIYALEDEHLRPAAERLGQIAGDDVLAIGGDVRNPSDCERVVANTVSKFGGLDILVTNMASEIYKSELLEATDADWRDEFELYVLSVIRLTRLAVPHMRERGGGAIVNLSSCGLHQTIAELSQSEVARLATAGFAKYLATSLAPEGIRVNGVLPGWMEGERMKSWLGEQARARGVERGVVYAENVAPIPMQRFGSAEDVANAVAFLASDRARYITGVNLRVDGGWCANPTF